MIPSDITPDWLTHQLRENGHLPTGTIVNVDVTPLESHASAALLLSVTYSTDAAPTPAETFICKLYLGTEFRKGIGEYTFYSTLAPEMCSFGSPFCYASRFDAERQVCFLLLEDVAKTHALTSNAFLTAQQYQLCIDALIKLHVHWWEHPLLTDQMFAAPRGGPLRLVQVLSAEQISANAVQFNIDLPNLLAQLSEKLSQTEFQFCELLGQHWFDLFAERLHTGQQTTMIHGDYHHYGNIGLPLDPADTIRILDWETWKRGIGVYDFAYLIAYQDQLSQQSELELLQYYHKGLTSNGVAYSWEQCLSDYQLSLLGCVFPPLFWSNAEALSTVIQKCKRWNCASLIR